MADLKISERERGQVDGGRLTGELGIDDGEIDWRKDFTQFDDDDERTLTGMSDTFERIADDLVEEFYEHLGDYDETVAVLDSSSKPVAALKKTQREYLLDLGRGEYGQSYFDRRARIGKIHDMLELGPEAYLGAYAIYYEGLADAIGEDVRAEFGAAGEGTDASVDADADTDARANADADADADGAVGRAVEEALGRFCSALKLMNLDQQVAMDTYIHSYNERIQTQLEKRSRLQREVEAEVEEPIETLQAGSERIVESSDRVASLADEGADRAEGVANEVSDLSATVEEVAATADNVAAKSERADELATEGRRSAEGAIDTMADVTDAAESVTEDVETLHERVSEIDEVVDVIDGIADQTNILALNASIEAARAGEAGSGFAVVADEVKSLAEDSQQQAGRIDAMISEIQSDALETVESLERTNEAIDESTAEVTAVLERLESIATAIEDATDGIQEVSRAADEQAASAERIAGMVDELAEQSEELREGIDEITDANRAQREGIDEVVESVRRLTETADGDGPESDSESERGREGAVVGGNQSGGRDGN